METHFATAARKKPFSSLQRELIVGSLLGDAYLMPTTSGFCFRVNHGMQQRDYVDWKFKMLAEFVRTPPRESGTCYYFRTELIQSFLVIENTSIPLAARLFRSLCSMSNSRN